MFSSRDCLSNPALSQTYRSLCKSWFSLELPQSQPQVILFNNMTQMMLSYCILEETVKQIRRVFPSLNKWVTKVQWHLLVLELTSFWMVFRPLELVTASLRTIRCLQFVKYRWFLGENETLPSSVLIVIIYQSSSVRILLVLKKRREKQKNHTSHELGGQELALLNCLFWKAFRCAGLICSCFFFSCYRGFCNYVPGHENFREWSTNFSKMKQSVLLRIKNSNCSEALIRW